MPAWPGGPCPRCGDDMPANVVHCQTCRELLNSDLTEDSVHIPVFQPLAEIESVIEVTPTGFYSACDHCGRELRLHRKYLGLKVSCKHCDKPLVPNAASAVAFYADCPYCGEELKNRPKYIGQKVACKHCEGHIHFVDP